MLREFALRMIAESGRLRGAQDVVFTDEVISAPARDIRISAFHWSVLCGVYAFYLPLPPNVFAVVTFPDGTNRNMSGGIYEAQPGLYKLCYIDKKERELISAAGRNITTSGEKISLTMLVRYRVTDPIALLRINNPIRTLTNHINTGVPRYIGSRKASEIADSPYDPQNKLFAFFRDRLSQRHLLSKAFMITSVEIKDFAGDQEFLAIMRDANRNSRQNEVIKKQEEERQELETIKNRYKLEKQELEAKLKRITTKADAEIENIKVAYEKDKQRVLQEIKSREIDLDNKRKYWGRRDNQFVKVFEAISNTISSGNQLSPQAIKYVAELVAELKKGTYNETDTVSEQKNAKSDSLSNNQKSVSNTTPKTEKIDSLTNTILDLLNPEK